MASSLNSAPFADVLSVLTRNNPGCSTVAAAAVLMTTSSASESPGTSCYQNSMSGHGNSALRGPFSGGLSLQPKGKGSVSGSFFRDSNINKI